MFKKCDVKIAKQWVQGRLFEQNGYYPRACDIQILSMGGEYDGVHIFHPVSVACRVGFIRYQFFKNKLIEKVDCSEPVSVGFDNFLNYVEGQVE